MAVDTINTSLKIPRRLSYAQDHYGFYNGEDDQTFLMPRDILEINNTCEESGGYNYYGFANRDPSFPEMLVGPLT